MKKRVIAVFLLICMLAVLPACGSDSVTEKDLMALPEFPAVYNMGVNVYVNVNGDVYTWGYDRYNNYIDKYGNGGYNVSLGQGTEILYNNTPTLIYQNISYIFFNRITTADGQMVEWSKLLEDTACVPHIVRGDRTDIYMAYANVYLTDNGDLYAVYEMEEADQKIPYGTEDTLILKNVVQFEGRYALKSDGTVWALERDRDTKMYNGAKKFMDSVSEIVDGEYTDTTLFLKTDKTLWTYGDNEYGQCGNGEYGDWDNSTRDYINEPYMVMENIEKAWVGRGHCFALDTEGNLYGWGLNDYNLLLDENYVQSSYEDHNWSGRQIIAEPKFIMSDVKDLFESIPVVFVIKTNDTLWAWGAADRGEMGNRKFAEGASLNTFDMAHLIIGKDAMICGAEKILDDVDRMIGTTMGLNFALKKDGTIMYWGYGEVYVNADDDWDTDMSQAYRTEAYTKHYIIPTPQVFDVETFQSEYQ